MRECLGWITNCSDEKRCPMNWLELAVTELPADVSCHVCGHAVRATGSEDEYASLDHQGALAAFPVVPSASLPASYGRFAGLGGGGGGAGIASVPPSNGAPPVMNKARTEPPKHFYCTLSNGEVIKLDKDSMVIGRSRTCDIVIPSAKVSRQHASLTRQDGEIYVEDLGSANGVWRSGEKLVGKVKISPGDVLNISEESLSFELR